MFKKKVYFVALTTYQVFVSDLYARYIKERYEDFDHWSEYGIYKNRGCL